VTGASAAAALLFRAKYGNPDESLALFGVTGTNGKTTTAFIFEHLLEKCGLLSTVEFRTGKERLPATHTTPDPETLFKMLRQMKNNGLTSAALELSSHALDQNRAWGARFRAAVFTNLTGDHLDYHRDMENYYQAKKIFFTRYLLPEGVAVINTDDPWGRRLRSELDGALRVITFGTSADAQWQIKNLQNSRNGLSFDLVSNETTVPVTSNLAGKFNAFNLAGAILSVMDYGVTPAEIKLKLKEKITVPGRLQMLEAPTGALFAVDFAHTDDALTSVLNTLRPLTGKKLFCVFGAGGDRDKTKRPRMGRAASGADMLIITSDNPRSEDPEQIISEIVSGVPQGTCFEIQPDRRKALQRAYLLAREGDIVLVAGKGHENYQEIGGVKYDFSDIKVICDCFKGDNNEKTDA
jgi:UDP-N-acetylmuramoyl-L-alanyl-D-glutamate--2,6-diaminopimelate ligase